MMTEEELRADDPYNTGTGDEPRSWRRAPLPEKRLTPRWIPGLLLVVVIWWMLAVIVGLVR